MDFFEHQEVARRKSHVLVFYFILALLGIIAAVYGLVVVIFALTEGDGGTGEGLKWWDPSILFFSAAGTGAVVFLASTFKTLQLSGGGAVVARELGGRELDVNTTDFHERRLLNLVEEMAIASGVPVPTVYVMDAEDSINAFAAGKSPSDAVIGVTRGCMTLLTRDELQGVIAHEFSHILNGDMRLNIRLMGLLFGILFLALMGEFILRNSFRAGGGSNRKEGAGLALVMLVGGLGLLVIGYVGAFFANLIKASVSRQREFLADASAVQFTRNPDGITGALKKIGGYALGGSMNASHAQELGHFFFAQAFLSSFGGLWATHPPLEARIRAVDPQWDGQLYEPPVVVDIARESSAIAGFGGGQRFTPDETLRRVYEAQPDLPPPLRSSPPIAFQPARIVADVGALTDSHFRHAQLLLDTIPTRLREATRDTATAQALVYGLLLDGDKAARDRQQALVEKHAGAEAASTLSGLRSALSLLDPVSRLPLLQLSLPALRALDAKALERFATTLDELVHADGRVTPFEYALQKMLLHQLRLAQAPLQRVQYDSFDAVRAEIAVVLSALAHLSPKDSAPAFAEGTAQIPVIARQIALLAPAASSLEQVDAALDKLALSSLPIKQRLLVAAGHVIASDGTVSVGEGEAPEARSSAGRRCSCPS